MIDDMNQIVNDAETYVQRSLAEDLPKEYVFHNFLKTMDILDEALEIGDSIMLDDDEMEILALSVLFSFTGFTQEDKDHYAASAQIAQKFLNDRSYPKEKIEAIKSTILSLNNDNQPETRVQEAFLDAHNIMFGKNSFLKRNAMLKLEKEFIECKSFDEKKWYKDTFSQIQKHDFHTIYAKKKYNKKKKKNIKKLKELISSEGNIKDNKPFSFNPFGRSVETMFRNNLRGHLELSVLADNKANIMLSINAIILSIILTIMLPNIMAYPEFLVPTILLIISCVTAIVFATLATRPKITSGTFTKEDIKRKRTNLLFFGNFFNMQLDDFQWGMSEMMKDRDYLYSSMIKDFYFLGLVLHKKFLYLRICYNVFMFGFIISIMSYLVTYFIVK